MKVVVDMGLFATLRFLIEAESEREAEQMATDHLLGLKAKLEDTLEAAIRSGLGSQDGRITHIWDSPDCDFTIETENSCRIGIKPTDNRFVILCIGGESTGFQMEATLGSEEVFADKQSAEETAESLREAIPGKVFWVEEVELKAK